MLNFNVQGVVVFNVGGVRNVFGCILRASEMFYEVSLLLKPIRIHPAHQLLGMAGEVLQRAVASLLELVPCFI